MDATVRVTIPAEAEFDALIARTETDDQAAFLRQLRKELLFDLFDLESALTMGTRIGTGKANPSADIRYVPKHYPLAVVVWIFEAERKIWITHFETLPSTWPQLEEDEFVS